MAVNIQLTVDTAQAKQALNEVNSAITQIKVNGADVSIGGKKLANETKDVSKAVNQTSKNIKNNADQTSKSILKQLKAFKQNAQQSMTTFATGMVSVWTLIILAVQLATKAFTYFFENLTENIQKLTIRGQTAIKMAQKTQQEAEKKIKAAKELVKRLEQLNRLQSLNTDQQRLANSIVNKLNKQYKDLGITLDQTTGKYKNLYAARIKLDQLSRRQQAQALREQIDAQRNVVNAALVKAFGRGIQLDKFVNGRDFFGIAEALGGTMGYQNADMLAKMWNSGDIDKRIDVLERLIGDLSMSEQVVKNAPEALDALSTLRDYQNQLKDLYSIDTDVIEANQRLVDSFEQQRDKIKTLKDAIDALKKAYEDAAKANDFADASPEAQIEALQKEVEVLEKSNEQLARKRDIKDEIAKRDATSAEALRKQLEADQAEAKRLDAEREKIEGQLKDARQRISNYKVKAEESSWGNSGGYAWIDYVPGDESPEQKRYLQLADQQQKRADALQKQQVANSKQLAAARGKMSRTELEYQQAQEDALYFQTEALEIEKQRQQNINAIQAKTRQIAQIEKKLEEERQKAAEKQAQKLRKQQEGIDNFFKTYQQNQTKQYLKLLGKQKEALLLEAKINAEKAKGAALTEEEVKAIQGYVDIQQALDEATNASKFSLNTNGTITNQLASKGGFASSVVTDRAQDINKQIYNQQRKQFDVTSKIKDAIEKYSVIQ